MRSPDWKFQVPEVAITYLIGLWMTTRQIDPLNRLLQQFGEISGLKVQPKKSILIPLNISWKQSRCHGYPVLAYGSTTRIL
ncbi:hypothetical protein PHMEG_0008097 [Phytophthora megakarya]|uniref:Uncharacterized protein n=1 Tax=Phytophthora megakarya TaxID=4795 RepID=A0A225WJV2_9STRA|nr:hypothetical protein PHMEG_0008097 [Phytophthora megakarya]